MKKEDDKNDKTTPPTEAPDGGTEESSTDGEPATDPAESTEGNTDTSEAVDLATLTQKLDALTTLLQDQNTAREAEAEAEAETKRQEQAAEAAEADKQTDDGWGVYDFNETVKERNKT